MMHAFQSVATPFSSKDWGDGEGTCEQHFERMKMVEKEVIGTIKINAVFLVLHILPLAYLGNSYLVFFSKYVHLILGFFILPVRRQHRRNRQFTLFPTNLHQNS